MHGKSQRAIFFRTVQQIPFRVRAVAVNKIQLEKRFIGMSGQDFTIDFISQLTLRASELDVANDVLIIDAATLSFLRTLRIRLQTRW